MRATFVLSHRVEDGKLIGRSFARWLTPYMMKDVLRLDVIAGFKEEEFNRLTLPPKNVSQG